MRDKDKLVIWPIYFDIDLSWSKGRRVPRNLAVKQPKIENIAKAAYEEGLNPELKKESAHPKRPWIKNGLILIDKKLPKNEAIKRIAKKLPKTN
ncbi:signal recognition particle protein Srp19 [Candidatus Bathyarchaeota archaeon]|nr:signal recognition particle protein Srp19 [Candidatus Bathyarchaeota archaeon]